jgi:hypothetical protein
MPYLGRYQLGQFVPLAVRTVNGSDVAGLPDDAPAALVYSDSGKVLTQLLPIKDRFAVTGFFFHRLPLGAAFAAGRHWVLYQWLRSGTHFAESDVFEIGDGGHADGAVLALHHYRRPNAEFVVQQLDSGKLVRGRNPRL